jgi:8-oxo-dGTP diphosphatase
MMKTKICVGGFLMKKDRILFGKRVSSKSWSPGLWDIPGGQALKNEHPLLALSREFREETGIRILNAELIRTMQANDGDQDFTYHIYRITHYKGRARNCSKEHSRLRWLTKSEIKNKSMAIGEYVNMID